MHIVQALVFEYNKNNKVWKATQNFPSTTYAQTASK
jgi:hypothetical protein